MTDNASQGQEVCDKVHAHDLAPETTRSDSRLFSCLRFLENSGHSKECFCFLRLLVLRYLQSTEEFLLEVKTYSWQCLSMCARPVLCAIEGPL